jgi:hypothetical protein
MAVTYRREQRTPAHDGAGFARRRQGRMPGNASPTVMALVMPRRCRRADIVGLMVTGASRRRNPLGRRCRGHHGLKLVEARDALRMKLGVGDRPAFFLKPRHPKRRVGFQEAIVFLGFFQVGQRIPVQVAWVDARGRRHHHGWAVRLCAGGRYGHRKASGRESQARCSLDHHAVTLFVGDPVIRWARGGQTSGVCSSRN